MTKHINIDELFLRLWNGDYDKSYEKTLEGTKQQLKDLILEIIGEDDTEVRGTTQSSANPLYWTKKTTYRNDLREEQRQKLKELFNHD